MSTSAILLVLQIKCIKTCFFPQYELKKYFVNLKSFHQDKSKKSDQRSYLVAEVPSLCTERSKNS